MDDMTTAYLARVVQGTDEWMAARAGKITASNIHKMLSAGKGSAPSVTRENYKAQLVAERLTGKPCGDDFKSRSMEQGNEREPLARAAYEFYRDVTVTEVGFVAHPLLPDVAGASPDGLVGLEGLVQIKCPEPKGHIANISEKTIGRPYMLQMQWEMACTRREWCDFVSFNPDFPDRLQMKVVRIARDPDTIGEIELALRLFNSEIEKTVEALRAI